MSNSPSPFPGPYGDAVGSPEDVLRQVIEEHIPFNRHLGVTLERLNKPELEVEVALNLRPEHIGNSVRQMPHGGLLATLVDAASGTAAALTLDDILQAPSLATVDMRVDYLKPARGKRLTAVSRVMRSGRSVVVVRTDVFDDDGTLVVLGTSTFAVDRSPAGE
jgi:uncharacterized protein (TIGR00369 family)